VPDADAKSESLTLRVDINGFGATLFSRWLWHPLIFCRRLTALHRGLSQIGAIDLLLAFS
jgi:hypothetical protein